MWHLDNNDKVAIYTNRIAALSILRFELWIVQTTAWIWLADAHGVSDRIMLQFSKERASIKCYGTTDGLMMEKNGFTQGSPCSLYSPLELHRGLDLIHLFRKAYLFWPQ